MTPEDRVYVAGHRGLVGSAIVRKLGSLGFDNLLLRTRDELDLTNQSAVRKFFAAERPTHVIVAAARVGGILANATYPADFIRDNLLIELNVIDAAASVRTEKLLMLGSSCIYPRMADQPIKEDYLLTGPLEPTNAPYAIAKIAGIALCEAYHRQFGSRFISAMPTNLYGPGDNFDLTASHVIPALICKIDDARRTGATQVEIWGTGTPRREFLYVDDVADACVFLMERYEDPLPINVGTGVDISIAELASLIADVVGYSGTLRYDPSKPDGTPRKLLDVSRINRLGWRARTDLREGIVRTYRWYEQNLVEQDRNAQHRGKNAERTHA